MLAAHTPLTVTALPVEPYLHLDNRGLVIFDGRRGVLLAAATLPWVAETFEIILNERRATRTHRDHILGGFLSDDDVATIYGGPTDDLATLRLDKSALAELVTRLRSR
jgi:hypothetical protein